MKKQDKPVYLENNKGEQQQETEPQENYFLKEQKSTEKQNNASGIQSQKNVLELSVSDDSEIPAQFGVQIDTETVLKSVEDEQKNAKNIQFFINKTQLKSPEQQEQNIQHTKDYNENVCYNTTKLNKQQQQELEEKKLKQSELFKQQEKSQKNLEKQHGVLSNKVYFTFVILNAYIPLCVYLGSQLMFNTMSDHIQYIYEWEDDEVSTYLGLIQSLNAFGALLGCYFSGSVVQYGRRKALIIGNIIFIIGSLLTIIRYSPLLLAGRIIQGYSVGQLYVFAQLYIKEITPNMYLGTIGAGFGFAPSSGLLIAVLLGYGLPDNEKDTESQYWRFQLLFFALLAFINLFIFTFIFQFEPVNQILKNEKPRSITNLFNIFGVNKENDEKQKIESAKESQRQIQENQKKMALKTLTKIYTKEYLDEYVQTITDLQIQEKEEEEYQNENNNNKKDINIRDSQIKTNSEQNQPDVQVKEDHLTQNIDNNSKNNNKSLKHNDLKLIFSKRYLKRFIICTLLQTFVVTCLVNPISANSIKIIQEYESKDIALQFTVYMTIADLLSAIFNFFTMSIFGRKTIIIGGMICVSLCVTALPIFEYADVGLGLKYILVLFKFTFSSFFGPSILYASEILTEAGIGYTWCVYWFLSLITYQLFPWMAFDTLLEFKGTFIIFAVFCYFIICILVFMMKETKNKTSNQIDELFGFTHKDHNDINQKLQPIKSIEKI